MSVKTIGKGDICRVRHNNSGHGFKENTLVVIKRCFPRNSETPKFFLAATRKESWYIDASDITLFERNKDEDEDDFM